LAPEHGRRSYGLPAERITPGQLYDREYAEEAFHMAREAVSIARNILRHLGYNV